MKDIKSPLFLNPYIADYLWGGSKLITEWGKDPSKSRIAETWELSAYPEKESSIGEGPFKGKTISTLLISHPEIFGLKIKEYPIFPLLIKIINAEQNLSVQVHPSDYYAKKNEGQLGKSEIWYIADAKEGSQIYLGFNRTVTKDEIKERIKYGTLTQVLNKVSVKKGDVVIVKPGTVHALLEGLVVIEVQENSNITYRLYDYQRKDSSGKERDLHIEKALDVIITDQYLETIIREDYSENNYNELPFRLLDKNEYFCAFEINTKKNIEISCSVSFVSLTVIEGQGKFDTGEIINKGFTYFLPANIDYSIINLDSKLEFRAIAVTLGNINEEEINVLFRD